MAEDLQDLLRTARARFDNAWDADYENRVEGEDDLLNLAGFQWDPIVKQEREDDERPCATENRLPQFVDAIVGDIRQQKPSAKVRPVDDEADPKTAEVMTSLLRDIEGRSQNSQPYVRAAESAVQCGIGHFRILTRYSRIGGFEQEIVQEPIPNPFAVVWDPLARSVTRDDARFCFVTSRMDRAEFKKLYPDAQVVNFDGGEMPENYGYVRNWYDAETVRVCEYWYKEPVKRRFARFPDGKIIELDKGEPDPADAEVREIDDVKVCVAKISGLEVLEKPQEWLTRDIPIIPVLGKEIVLGDKVVRHGAIRFAKDPQWRFNVWLSTLTELVGLQPKAPYLATAKQIAGYETEWKDANVKNRSVLLYNSDPAAGGPPARQAPPQGSEVLVRLMQMADEAMKATTGQYAASLGAPSNETSGKAIGARQMQANTIAFVYTDNLTASVRHAGQIMLDLIPKIYDTPRVVRLLNEDGSEGFERVNVPFMEADPETGQPVEKRKFDLTVGRYDLVISTGPAYATKRAEAAQAMMEFIKYAPDAAKVVLDLVAKNMDWPGADEFAERFRKTLPPELQPKKEEPDEEDMARAKAAEEAAQLRKATTDMGLRKQEAETQEAEAKAEKAQFEAFESQLTFMIQSGAMDDVLQGRLQEMLAGNRPLPPGQGAPMAA